MNGYFQLMYEEQASKLIVFPPTDGGEPAQATEIMNYLNGRNIKFEMTSLVRELKDVKEKKIILLSNEKGISEEETFVIKMSDDRMLAVARFYPPSVGGALLGVSDIINDLKKLNITSGINQDAIDSFMKHRVYCTDIVIAVGQKPVHGTDARIEYYFSTNLSAKPTLLDDGSVDFFHLNTMNHCVQGELLAKLFKEDPGKVGTSITGEKIKPREVKKMSLKYGRNISLSEDRTELRSEVNGHVSLVEGKVFVSDIYVVENVDTSIGNIDYTGSVQVNGNVCCNFTVKSQGNVIVQGIVEGAFIEAAGDIVITRGVSGMNRAVLKAGGNVIAKYIENATVEAGGYVEADAILHSKIMSKDEVRVMSNKGFATGGVIQATKAVRVKHLGSSMGADTLVEIGVDPAMKERFTELEKEIRESKALLASITPVIQATGEKLKSGTKLTPNQIEYFKKLAMTSQQKKEQLGKDEEEIETLRELLLANTQAEVAVSGTVYPGVKIVISDVSMIVKEPMKYCRFVRKAGEVKMISMN